MERRKQQERARLKWLRGAVRQALDEIDHGEGVQFGSMDKLEIVVDQIGEEASATVLGKRRRA